MSFDGFPKAALLVALAVGLAGRADAQTGAPTSDGGARALPACPQTSLLAYSKKVEGDGLLCLAPRKRWKKASYVHLDLKLALSGQVDEVGFDGEPLTPAEESCLREKIALWRLPKQGQACRYDGFLVPVPEQSACKSPLPLPPKPDPELESPFRLGLAMDSDGYVLAGPNSVLAPSGWGDLAAQLAEVRRVFPHQFTPDMLFVVVKRTSTPDTWVDDLMTPLWRAGVRRVAIRVDDTLRLPADGCVGTAKDVAAWRKLFKSLAPSDFQKLEGSEMKSFSTPSPRPPIVGKEVYTLALLCAVIPKTPPDLHNGLIAHHCAKLSSCAGECAAEMLAFSNGDQLSALESCKAFAAVKPQCSPVHPPNCAQRWIFEQMLGAVAATAKGTPPLTAELAKGCRAAGLLP